MAERVNREVVEDFVSHKHLAVVGVSTNPHKFGRMAYNELKAKGYHVVPVNRYADRIDGEVSYPNLRSLPVSVDGVVIVVPPNETEDVLRDVAESGIKRVWMQQGAESEKAIQFCHDHGISEVHGECILMYAAPVKSYHKVHRTIRSLLGRLPK